MEELCERNRVTIYTYIDAWMYNQFYHFGGHEIDIIYGTSCNHVGHLILKSVRAFVNYISFLIETKHTR